MDKITRLLAEEDFDGATAEQAKVGDDIKRLVDILTRDEDIDDLYKNLAYAVQKITEDVMVYLANWLHEKTGSKN